MAGINPALLQGLMGQSQPFQGGGASGTWAPQPQYEGGLLQALMNPTEEQKQRFTAIAGINAGGSALAKLAQVLLGQSPPPDPSYGQGATLPFSQTAQGDGLSLGPGLFAPMQRVGEITSGQLPLYAPDETGRVFNPEAIQAAVDLGQLAMTGGFGTPAEGFELGAAARPPPASRPRPILGADPVLRERIQGVPHEAAHVGTISPSQTSTRGAVLDTYLNYLPASLDSMRGAGIIPEQRAIKLGIKPGTSFFDANMALLRNKRNYPAIRRQDLPRRFTSDDIAKLAMNINESNLGFWLKKATPEDLAGRRWYDSAHDLSDATAGLYRADQNSMAGNFAALSPQKDWNINRYLGKQVADIYHTKQEHRWDSAMDAWAAEKIRTAERVTPFIRALEQLRTPEVRARNYGSLLQELYDDPLSDFAGAWTRVFEEAHGDFENPGTHNFHEFRPDGSLGDLIRTQEFDPATGLYMPAKATWGGTSAIKNALRSLMANGDRHMISDAMGGAHKVRDFQININDPSNPEAFTGDTHAIGAGWMMPFSADDIPVQHGLATGTVNSAAHGFFGTYGLTADPARRVAARTVINDNGRPRTLLPRELQSITWSMKKNNFDPLTEAQDAEVRGKWADYNKGRKDLAETQQEIWDISQKAKEQAMERDNARRKADQERAAKRRGPR